MTDPAVMPAVKSFILERFLVGEDPARLTPTTPLVTGGILDSLALLDLVAFLEQTFGVEFEAHEVDPGHFDSLQSIDTVVRAKLAK
ncbi:MAG TPA: acyl carrier protein [Gemmatimonadaceae bacterium]|nr:acyl carrier protein [Gemmatimonadaceae bacterium]